MTANSVNWAPCNLILADNYAPKAGVAYNDSNLTVRYRLNGAAPTVKTLALADWSEGVEGGYSVRFSAAECAGTGQFDYWVTYTGCVVYYGSLEMQDTDAQIAAAIATLAADIATRAAASAITSMQTDVTSIKSKVNVIPANPLLNTDSRLAALANLDAAVSSLATAAALTQLAAAVAGIPTDSIDLAPIMAILDKLQFDSNDRVLAAQDIGPGAVSWDYVVYTSSAKTATLEGVEVWLTTDSLGVTDPVAPPQFSDANGKTSWLLDPGWYYVWRRKSGYTFSNPDTEEVTA